ncbi:dTDP-4-dehydrorhamnose 3,5-epimerase [Phyllobacterium endophyticum]|uniref:dTDP-4-dehydrorhamnose 3,5-epimerase n=1 Tax=Phyllobacterium endophyticum TaxID=1149773 RepID=A0A2P7AZL4_9HYPH|nr:dTDP-4-dehydrorhamnose 3,5-epimerase [Phyllobacterium endophyticum]MBB3235767.1 dTDP-4-dehydrorhamnose 3,5-epimerase [Phyllobacterium endophyticum]PSH59630.1 dTDP-4-dehydrorhamnose 3,5-epimerase [Phyllobacterium endophyticum]TYR41771.1 dTDP-4-dehydrorhamnose 3,5-epimerase [Phyllobacterium endophyticum]
MSNVISLALDGVVEIRPRKFGDDRGFFSETYNAKALADAGINLQFVQDNHSLSAAKGVLRGLHYQLPPRAQDKLVRVVSGSILDVVVDIRRASPTFRKWIALEVSAAKWNQILVPKGFAHGFLTLEENTEVIYKVTDYYSPEHDRSIRFDDPSIGIEWPFASPAVQLSDKDRNAPSLDDADLFP